MALAKKSLIGMDIILDNYIVSIFFILCYKYR